MLPDKRLLRDSLHYADGTRTEVIATCRYPSRSPCRPRLLVISSLAGAYIAPIGAVSSSRSSPSLGGSGRHKKAAVRFDVLPLEDSLVCLHAKHISH